MKWIKQKIDSITPRLLELPNIWAMKSATENGHVYWLWHRSASCVFASDFMGIIIISNQTFIHRFRLVEFNSIQWVLINSIIYLDITGLA